MSKAAMPIGTAAVLTAERPLERVLKSITEVEPPSILPIPFEFPYYFKVYAVGLPAYTLVHNRTDKAEQRNRSEKQNRYLHSREKHIYHFSRYLVHFPARKVSCTFR
jgi:hypothetical protein